MNCEDRKFMKKYSKLLKLKLCKQSIDESQFIPHMCQIIQKFFEKLSKLFSTV